MNHELLKPYRTIIESEAKLFGLPASLLGAIILTESSGDTWAIRYEPGFFDRYVKPMFTRMRPPKPAGVSRRTEARARSMSFGLMQIMGQVAREHGFNDPFLTSLCEPDVGIHYGAKHLHRFYNRYRCWEDAVAAFNQGSNRRGKNGKYRNQEYVDKVMSRKAELDGRAW